MMNVHSLLCHKHLPQDFLKAYFISLPAEQNNHKKEIKNKPECKIKQKLQNARSHECKI